MTFSPAVPQTIQSIRSLMSLLLPALFPSWRFFMTVGPSPRVEVRKVVAKGSSDWVEVAPRPARIGAARMMRHLIWNADWNEQLFLVSCAERLIQNPTQHSVDELTRRVARRVGGKDRLQIRLVFVTREADDLVTAVCWQGEVFRPETAV